MIEHSSLLTLSFILGGKDDIYGMIGWSLLLALSDRLEYKLIQ